MKRLSLIVAIYFTVITLMWLIMGKIVYAEGLSNSMPQKDLHTRIISFLKEADQLKFEIDYRMDLNQIIAPDIAAVVGKFSTFDAIMSVLGKYFDKEAAKIEIHKIGLFVINNRIGGIMATGEEAFLIDENSKFEFIKDDEDEKLINVMMVGEHGTQKEFFYRLKWIEKRWIIVDEAEKREMLPYESDWVGIRVSSELPVGGRYGAYSARNVWDKDPKTAWVEGKGDDGVGEWIDFAFFPDSRVIGAIKIINGYAKSEGLYQANNRVKRVRISFDDGTSFEAELNDGQIQPQLIRFPMPKKTERIRLTILEVYPGTKYRDTCISEIEFQ